MSFRLYGMVTLPLSVTTPSTTWALTLSKIVNCGYRSTCFDTSWTIWKSPGAAAQDGALIASVTMTVATTLANISFLLSLSLSRVPRPDPGKIKESASGRRVRRAVFPRISTVCRGAVLRGEQLEHEHCRYARTNQQNLPHRRCVGAAAVEARYQVGHRHVEEAGGGERQE